MEINTVPISATSLPIWTENIKFSDVASEEGDDEKEYRNKSTMKYQQKEPIIFIHQQVELD